MRSIDDSWQVRVWSCVRGVARLQVAKRAILPSAAEAVAWACDVLRQHGATAFVDGCVQPLEKFLVFSPCRGTPPL